MYILSNLVWLEGKVFGGFGIVDQTGKATGAIESS